MGRWLTTAVLCAASMIGSALIASQGFAPDPLPESASSSIECQALPDGHARQDCLELAE